MYKFTQIIDISKIKRISFRPDINGLRAIAVLSVVFYHSNIEIFRGGWLGVDIFFVISGYLISNIIISELNDGKFYFKNFYLRRIRRIFPALFSTLLLTIPIAYFLLTPKSMEEYIDSLISSVFFYANFHFMNLDFYVAESTSLMPLIHMWSLAIEEQYYLLFPAFAYFIYRYCKKYFTLIIATITIFSIYINTLTSSTDKFYKLEYRIWELFFGVLIMILSQNIKIKHLEKIGFPLMIFPIIYFDDYWINDLEPKIIALVGISLVIFSNTEHSILSKFLNFKPISFIGLSSYSIYLLHQPLFSFFRVIEKNSVLFTAKFSGMPQNLDILNFQVINFPNSNLINLILILLTVSLGAFYYRNIELKLKKNIHLIIMFSLVISFSIFQFSSPSTFLFPSVTESNISDETMFSDYNCAGKVDNLNVPFMNLENCYIDNGSEEFLVILGDSSSAALAKSILHYNLYTDYNFLFITLSYEKFFEEFKNFYPCKNCILEWLNSEYVNLIISVELHRFIETEGAYYTAEFSGQNLENFNSNLELLSTLVERVVLIEPFPTMLETKPGPKEFLNQQLYDKQLVEIYLKLSDWKDNTKASSRYLKNIDNRIPNLKILHTDTLFCNTTTNKCSIFTNGNLLYVDQVHLSTKGGYIISVELYEYLK